MKEDWCLKRNKMLGKYKIQIARSVRSLQGRLGEPPLNNFAARYLDNPPMRPEQLGQLPIVDFPFVRFQVLHDNERPFNPLIRAFALTNNVEQSPLFATRKRVENPAALFILQKQFPQLLRQRQAVFAGVFFQRYIDLRSEIKPEFFSKSRVYGNNRQTCAIVQDGALVFLFTVQRTNYPA